MKYEIFLAPEQDLRRKLGLSRDNVKNLTLDLENPDSVAWARAKGTIIDFLIEDCLSHIVGKVVGEATKGVCTKVSTVLSGFESYFNSNPADSSNRCQIRLGLVLGDKGFYLFYRDNIRHFNWVDECLFDCAGSLHEHNVTGNKGSFGFHFNDKERTVYFYCDLR